MYFQRFIRSFMTTQNIFFGSKDQDTYIKIVTFTFQNSNLLLSLSKQNKRIFQKWQSIFYWVLALLPNALSVWAIKKTIQWLAIFAMSCSRLLLKEVLSQKVFLTSKKCNKSLSCSLSTSLLSTYSSVLNKRVSTFIRLTRVKRICSV